MRLQKWFETSPMSKADLARALGCSRGRVTQLLADDDQWVSRDLALKIAEVTEGAVTPNDFLGFLPCEPIAPAAADC